MTQEEYINKHPEQFKDNIDKWLFTEFGILGGCCSAEKSHEYHVARMVAERYEQNRLTHCDELTPEQAQVESDFIVNHLKTHKRTPTFIDAIEYGKRAIREAARAAFCEVRCKGKPSRSTCQSLGTCGHYDCFVKAMREGSEP